MSTAATSSEATKDTSEDKELSREQKRIKTAFGIVVVLSGFLLFFTFGCVYSHGNMAPYIISYTRLRSLDPARDVVKLSASPWLYGGTVITQGLSMSLGGLLTQRIGPRPTAAIAAAIFTGATFLTAVAVRLSFWAVVLTYGLLMGLGLGLGYTVPFYSAMQWLPKHTGLAIGLVMMGMGGSSFVYIPLQTAFINPNDAEPTYQPDPFEDFFYFDQEDILQRVPYVFIILGSIFAAVQLVAIPFLPEYRQVGTPSRSYCSIVRYVWSVVRPHCPSYCCCPGGRKKEEEEEGCTSMEMNDRAGGERGGSSDSDSSVARSQSLDSDSSKSSSKSKRQEFPDVTPLELVRRWDFYFIWISMFTLSESLTYFTSVYKIFGQSAKFSDHTLALVGSFGFMCNCAGRVLWGLFADHVSSKTVLIIIMGGLSTFMYTLYSTPLAGLVLYGLWVAFMYFLYGGAMSVYPTCCAVWYGRRYVSTNYGILFSSHSVASVVAIVVSMYGHTVLGWIGQFFFTASLCFVGVIFIIAAGERVIKPKKDTGTETQ